MNSPTNPPDDEVMRWSMTISSFGNISPIIGHFMDVDGEWVKHDDHARIVADLRARVEEAEREAMEVVGDYRELSMELDAVATERDAALAQLAALRTDLDEQCRLLGMGGSREAKLMGEVEGLRRELGKMRDSRQFYKDRVDLLASEQKNMRDPERTIVCNIIANGKAAP